MSPAYRALARALFRLYPRAFRASFGDEWWETLAWHWSRLDGRALGRLRFGGVLLRDALVALPAAHLSDAAEALGSLRPSARELGQVVRGLRRAPVFTAAAVASLAIGVGANTAIFSVVDAVLIEPLPYAHSDRLVIVWNEFASGQTRLPLAGSQIALLAEQPGLFEEIGGIWAGSSTLQRDDGTAGSLAAGTVTPNFFSVLGVSPALGRDFDRDAGAGAPPPGVVVSHEFWRTELGADPGAVGATVNLDGAATEVVGVLPAGLTLHFPPDGSIPARLDIYRPLPWDLTYLPPALRFIRVVGRLEPGVGLQDASIGVAAAGDLARERYPGLAASGDRLSTLPLHADAVRAARPALLALMGGAVFFALLAAANVASLSLARASARRRELAVRTCLGGTGPQLARLLLSESVILGVVGGGLGLLLGVVGADIAWGLRPDGVARVDELRLDATVVGFTAALTLGSILLFGLAPLGSARAGAPVETLKGGLIGGRAGRLREALVVGEVAIGLVLVVAAGLLTQSLARLSAADVGFDRGDAVTYRVPLPTALFQDADTRARMADEIEGRLEAIPGVRAVGAISHMPFAEWANWAGTAPPGHVGEQGRDAYFFDHRSVTPGYLPAIGARLLEGRGFTDADAPGADPVVIIDRVLAERAYPGESAVGRELKPTRFLDGDFVETSAVIVGVVEPMRDVSPAQPSNGQVFWPFALSARWELTWLVRSSLATEELTASVREQVAAVDPRLTVGPITNFDELFGRATARSRFVAMLGGALSAIALLLAALGLYGVMTYLAVQRLPEMGLRVVLGARTDDLVKGVLAKGLRLGLLGTAIGVAGALGVNRFLESLLFGVGARDPATVLGVVGVFLLVAAVASVRPALRAARVDPVAIIRD